MGWRSTKIAEKISGLCQHYQCWICCWLEGFILWLMNLQLFAHKLIKWLPGECADWFFDNIMTWSYCLHRRYCMSRQKNSLLINEHALNREPVPFKLGHWTHSNINKELMLRRRRQWELRSLLSNMTILQEFHSLFEYFFAAICTTTAWNSRIQRLVEDKNSRRAFSFQRKSSFQLTSLYAIQTTWTPGTAG